MTTSAKHRYLRVLGPWTPLARVFTFFASDGRSDPAAAWHAFTGTFNWAAPLTTAVPRTDLPGPVARPTPGGFLVSGQWRLVSHEGTGPWLALPMTARAHARAAECSGTTVADTARGLPDPGLHLGRRREPDVLVVSAKVLPDAVRTLPAAATGADDGEQGPLLRLENAYVPAGLATYAAGSPLRAEDAVFLWTAVTALALGAAERITDVLDRPRPGGAPRGSGRRPGPAAALHDERMGLAAALHGAPSAREGLAATAEKRLVAHVERAGNAVREVVAEAYERALTSERGADEDPLVRMIEESSPILHQLRFARQLLPLGEWPSRARGEHGERGESCR